MNTVKETILAEWIENRLLAIQSSREIFKLIPSLPKKSFKIDKKEKRMSAQCAASNVVKAVDIKKNRATKETIKRMIETELLNILSRMHRVKRGARH